MTALSGHPVEDMLKRRGFEVQLRNPREYLFFPDATEEVEDLLYGMLRRYSFRIFIRDVIKKKESFSAGDLTRYTGQELAGEYLGFLMGLKLIEENGPSSYRLKAREIFSFGDTLEWLVARIFEREFASPALWGLRLKGAEAGGDYDCIASVEGRLVYVETKSSPPKNIEEAEVSAFLKRAEALKPYGAIFLEDTMLRMKDKIVPFFEGLVEGREVKRVESETFSIDDKVFITNSGRDIAANLGLCVRHMLSPEGFWDIKGP